MLETVPGSQALNSGLLASVPNFVAARRVAEASNDQPHIISQHSFPNSATNLSSPLDVSRLPLKRSSTGPAVNSANSRSSLGAATAKKRQSTLPATTTHARLYKVLGDLFLLSGRMMDATVWYVAQRLLLSNAL